MIPVLIGALILPCLYAWFTIAANWDPYSATKNIKIAVVNEDEGVDSSIAGHLCLGDILEEKLKDNQQIGWVFTDRNSAKDNLESGKYYAVICLSSTFSEEVANIFMKPESRDFAKIQYYVNERENGAAVKITDTGASTIEKQINEQFVGKVTQVITEKACELAAAVTYDVAEDADTFSQRLDLISGNVEGLKNLMDSSSATVYQAQDTIYKTNDAVVSIKDESDHLYETIEEIKSKVDTARDNIYSLIQELKDIGLDADAIISIFASFESSLSDVSASLAETSSVLYKVSFTCEQLIDDLDTAKNLLNDGSATTKELADKLAQTKDFLLTLSSLIKNNLAGTPALIKDIVNADTSSLGTFMSKPVSLDNVVLNKIQNNGTAISPFFTNLAIWVLGIVLIALFRTEVEPPKRKHWTAKQAYVSRALLFSSAGIISALICAIGNLYVLGIQCENPAWYLFSCAFISVVYVNIIYMLAACFKHVGRAIACILVIMQIPGSSGMFPIQLMPEVFQGIYPFLPFSYGINALRECIISIDYVYLFLDYLALFGFFIVLFIIALYARDALAGINKLFDEELEKNTIMICDAKDHVSSKSDAIDVVVDNISSAKDAKVVTGVLSEIKAIYKKRSKIGLIALAVFPTLLLVAFSIIFVFVDIDINTKLIWMFVWMFSVIIIATFVIVNEYKYRKISLNNTKSEGKSKGINK